MTFDPVGKFRNQINAPISADLLTAGRAVLAELPETKRAGDLTRIYGHWTAAGYTECFGDYHLDVFYENNKWQIKMTHSPLDNAVSTFSDDYAEHTYARNEGAVGVAISAMMNATPNNFGDNPITLAGLDWLCMAVAAACKKYEIDVSGISDPGYQGSFWGETNFLTHAEAAHYPGDPSLYPDGPYYWTDVPSDGVTRGDLCLFTPLPTDVRLTFEMAVECGNALRARIHNMKVAL